MKREDYVFCIGYQGGTALVDGQAKRRYGKASIPELIDEGLFRAALSAALYDNDSKAIEQLIERYNDLAGTSLQTTEELMSLLGAVAPSDAIDKIIVIK